MPYGSAPPPEGAPVPPQELIGASIFLGLVSVVSISRHGPYLITLGMGRSALDAVSLGLIALNAVGFAGSLWLLALRRCASGTPPSKSASTCTTPSPTWCPGCSAAARRSGWADWAS